MKTVERRHVAPRTRSVVTRGATRRRHVVAAGLTVALWLLAGCADSGVTIAADTSTAIRPTTPSDPATTSQPEAETTQAPPVDDGAAPDGSATDGSAPDDSAPDGDALWIPPDPLPPGEPGDLIWARPLVEEVGGGQGWIVLYRSTTADGDPVAVSGVIVAPKGAPPAGPRPVVALAHSTLGIADECAPSRAVAAGRDSEPGQYATGLVAQGWVLAATDYRGLGTPGTHPYLVGQDAGRDVLDLVRASRRLPATGADAASPVVVIGNSQGGGASAFAAELAPTYAPDLDVRGAVAGSPTTEVDRRFAIWPPTGGPNLGYTMMIIAGFKAGYPELSFDSVLTSAGQAVLPDVELGCLTDVLGAFADDDPAALFTPGGPDTQWRDAIAANVAGQTATDVPIYVFHGDADVAVPVEWSADFQARACAAGTNVSRVVYPGLDHTSVVPTALGPAFAWLAERINGDPAQNGCP